MTQTVSGEQTMIHESSSRKSMYPLIRRALGKRQRKERINQRSAVQSAQNVDIHGILFVVVARGRLSRAYPLIQWALGRARSCCDANL